MEVTLLPDCAGVHRRVYCGYGSVLDEFQFTVPDRPVTLIGAVLGDMKTGIIIGGTLEMIAWAG